MCLWDLSISDKKPTRVIETTGELINSAWKPDGSVIAVGNKKELLTFIDANDGSVLQTHQSKVQINEFTWDYGEGVLLLTTAMGGVQMFEWPSMTLVYEVAAHSSQVLWYVFHICIFN